MKVGAKGCRPGPHLLNHLILCVLAKVFMLIEGWLADIPVIPSMAGVVSGWAAAYTTFAVIRYMIVGK